MIEPAIPREAPPGLTAAAEVAWMVGAIRAHGALRARSFYDTGHLVARLLERREATGAANIKELCAAHPLGISHMTANKYLQIARTFDRATALREGIEKCYALIVHSKALGREGEAARILAADEPIRGTRVRARAATAAEIYRATSALKKRARDSKEQTPERARAAETAARAEKLFRTLGVKRADAQVVRRGGRDEIALFIPVEVAETLERTLPQAFARFGVKLARQRPEWFEPLRAAGWKIRAAPS